MIARKGTGSSLYIQGVLIQVNQVRAINVDLFIFEFIYPESASLTE
jgi:hypothetical protein